jgi:hypothetical protein
MARTSTSIGVSTPNRFSAYIKVNTKSPGLFVKPRLLESGVSESPHFSKLSENFKNIFALDKKDINLVLPISGYAGHRRGASSQNFFGRSFREVSIQSKRYQRMLHKNALENDK